LKVINEIGGNSLLKFVEQHLDKPLNLIPDNYIKLAIKLGLIYIDDGHFFTTPKYINILLKIYNKNK
jgi:hypothetical protein